MLVNLQTVSSLTLGLMLVSSSAFAAGGDTLEQATQRGANYLVSDAVAFAKANDCQACHRQGAAMFGLSEALSNGYTIDEGDANGLGLLAVQNIRHQGPFRNAPTGRYWHTGGPSNYQNSTSSYAGYGLAGYDSAVSTRFSSDLVEAADDAVLRQTVSGSLGWWAEEHHNFPTTFGYVQNAARHIEVLRAARARADATRQAAYDAAIARAVAYIRSRASDYTQSTGGGGHGAVGYSFQAAWALLGLKAAGVVNSDPDVVSLQNRLLGTTSGATGSSWGYSAGHAADPYNTGLALYALCQSGRTLGDSAVSAAANWLNGQQAVSGVWNSPTHASQDVPTTFAILGLGCFGSLGVEVATTGSSRIKISSNLPSPQTVSFTVTVANTGAFGGSDSYSLAVLGGLPGWNAALSTQSVTVLAGSLANVTLTVTTGSNLPEALPVDFSVRATSQTSASVSATTNVTIYTDPPPPVTGVDTSVQIIGSLATKSVSWTNNVGVWDARGDGLYRNAGGNSWNAGAFSNEQIVSGRGYVEWVAGETNTYRMVGLGNTNSNASYTDIEFAIYNAVSGGLLVYESGANMGSFGTYQIGDSFRVEVNNGLVTYSKNGSIFYTSLKTAAYPLNVDTSFYTASATAQQIRISTNGLSAQVPSWTSLVFVTVPTTLIKHSGGTVWNGSVYSREQITDGTGWVEFVATEQNTHRMLGLSNGNTDSNWTDIDYAFYLVNNGTLQVRESGSAAIAVGSYVPGDVLRIEVSNGTITYYRNGALLRTAPTLATYPLNVDTSFYNLGATLDGVTLYGNLLCPVTSRTTNTVLSAKVFDANGILVQGPGAGVLTFYVAGVPVANDIDADGNGVFSTNWAPGSGWAANGVQDYRAIYSGIDRPSPQVDLLSSLASTTVVLELATDTDTDGLEDDLEINVVGTDPLVADTDGDGCLDGTEYNIIGSDPLLVDTDLDGVGDCVEFNAGTDPLADTSFPDADSDGVSDVADPFPCDADKSSVAFVPAEGQYGQLMFEDNWPAQGDLDFNDSVFAYNYKLFRNSDGLVTRFVLTIEPLALGADIQSGIAVRLPVSSTAIRSATRVVSGGSQMSLQGSPNESEVVVVIASDVREFFGNQAGLINVQGGQSMIDAPQIVVTMDFNAPFALGLGNEPFDLFYFRTLNGSHQIHRPAYQGTDTMDRTLFGTATDGSSSGRWFVDGSGLPFVIALPQISPWTEEFTPLTGLYPNLSTFAATGGTQATDFYSSQVLTAQAFPPSLALVQQSGGIIDAIPTVVYDRTCTSIPLGL